MAKPQYPKPLELSGALDKFSYEDTTPGLGREYINVNIIDDILKAQNADEHIRDLAITISQRGVAFFRAQDNLTNDFQKELMQRLGEMSGKPETSKLHVFPLAPAFPPEGATDDRTISYVNSVGFKYMFDKMPNMDKRSFDAAQWHSDIQFEPVPADYTSLRLIQLPRTGGDTLWASGYELYDRLSKPYQDFLGGMTVTCRADCLIRGMQHRREQIVEGERGSPLNVGQSLTAVHPFIRTHPVTGWNCIFGLGQFAKRINEVNSIESEELLQKFYNMVQENHDIQCRFRWRNPNDIAIWDNRCTFHRATFDYLGLGDRYGNRAVGIGEVPYFQYGAASRSEMLGVKSLEGKGDGEGGTNGIANGASHGGHGMAHGGKGIEHEVKQEGMDHGSHEMAHGGKGMVHEMKHEEMVH